MRKRQPSFYDGTIKGQITFFSNKLEQMHNQVRQQNIEQNENENNARTREISYLKLDIEQRAESHGLVQNLASTAEVAGIRYNFYGKLTRIVLDSKTTLPRKPQTFHPQLGACKNRKNAKCSSTLLERQLGKMLKLRKQTTETRNASMGKRINRV